MQKEKWINEVLESTKGLTKAQPSPFLFEKIAQAIETAKQQAPVLKPGLKWAFAISVIILVTVNLFSVIKNSSSEKNKTVVGVHSEYDHSTIYNY